MSVAVAFDLKAPTFRHKMYDDYKGNRKPMPDELRPQIPLLKETLNIMGVKTYEKEGFEADDIIGTLAKKSKLKTYIYTGDRDAFQLVDDNITVCYTKRGITETDDYTGENFKDKTGLTPIQIIDLKALMGDASDNIPGVKGIGEKTALSLLQQFGSVENIYSDLNALPIKTREKLSCGRESAELSKTLATIDVNMPISFNEEETAFKMPLDVKVKEKFTEL